MKPNGWAAELFKSGKAPTFACLEERVEMTPWRGYYRMASWGVHANASGLIRNIQDLTDSGVVVAGPSNASLADPAQCTLIALSRTTRALMAFTADIYPETTDEWCEALCGAFVTDKAIGLIVEQAIGVLVEVDKQMQDGVEAADSLAGRVAAVLRWALRNLTRWLKP